MIEAITIRGIEIGRRTDAGHYLHKSAFLMLPQGERVAAYLALVWPQARQVGTLHRVCGIRQGNFTNRVRELLQLGTIRRVGYGWYRLGREVPGG